MLRINRTRTAVNWRDKLAEIKAAEQEHKENFSIMTAYEHKTAYKMTSALKEQYNPAITEGALADHETARLKLKFADAKVKGEHKKETARWDAQKLASEMQVYTMLTDQIVNTKDYEHGKGMTREKELERLFTEAKDSGDKYKARAAAEVLKSIKSKGNTLDERIKFSGIAQTAKADLEKIRSTPELEKAYEDAETVYKEYRTARQDLINTSIDIGGGDPTSPWLYTAFSQAIKQVQDINGELVFFEPDDPHITGVKIPLKELSA